MSFSVRSASFRSFWMSQTRSSTAFGSSSTDLISLRPWRRRAASTPRRTECLAPVSAIEAVVRASLRCGGGGAFPVPIRCRATSRSEPPRPLAARRRRRCIGGPWTTWFFHYNGASVCRLAGHDRKREGGLVSLHLLPPAPHDADRVWREDVDLLLAQPRFAELDLRLELLALVEQDGKDLLLGDVGDLFALDVDDPASVAGEDRDVGALALAGAVHDAAHDRDLDRQADLARQRLANVLHEREQVNLDAPARGARDQLGADALAHAEDVEQLEAVVDLVDGVAGVADADRVADAGRQQVAQRNDRADRPRLARAGVRDAEVQRVVEAL